eukprot:TRINITY_DN11573_c0_g1_i1.p1 TRINITY_DN11573_c0_g1~~TRINITY_DN11573_c0_g1_i1.p1  ORF type:complete len:361 (-),score=72.77 TRINITY_DN11573_c0_g1_i1:137-1219(-)
MDYYSQHQTNATNHHQQETHSSFSQSTNPTHRTCQTSPHTQMGQRECIPVPVDMNRLKAEFTEKYGQFSVGTDGIVRVPLVPFQEMFQAAWTGYITKMGIGLPATNNPVRRRTGVGLPEVNQDFFQAFPGILNRLEVRGKNLKNITSVIVTVDDMDHKQDLNSMSEDGKYVEILLMVPLNTKVGRYTISFYSGEYKIEKILEIVTSKRKMGTPKVVQGDHHCVGDNLLYTVNFHKHRPKDLREVNRRDCNGASLLMKAVANKKYDLVQFLLDNYADPNICTFSSEFPIHLAAEQGDNELIELLLQYGAFINVVNMDKENALFYAYQNNQSHTVEYLIKKGARQDQINIKGFNYKGQKKHT